MKRCPITYQRISDSDRYSTKGLKLLFRKPVNICPFPYSAQQQVIEATARASKISIQGVQPKLSAVFSAKSGEFVLKNRGGKYILKPQNPMFPFLPENEDLTMKIASAAGIDVPLTGLLECKDGSFTYFIRRFDRTGRNKKVHVEDFAQLSGKSRDTKYSSSMEKVAGIIDRFCTFPVPEKKKLFERVLFSFVTGNEDMHLKNFSLIRTGNTVSLSPAYDLLNTTIALQNPTEEMALPIRGKKNKLTTSDLVDYFGMEVLGLNNKTVESVLLHFQQCINEWHRWIDISFLPEKFREKYRILLEQRMERIG